MDYQTVHDNVRQLTIEFAENRVERQKRRELDRADFDRMRDAGLHLTGVPVEDGGLWVDLPNSVRPICDLLRTLAHGDSSVALVNAMHPGVLCVWLSRKEVPEPYQAAWSEQRGYVIQTAYDGHWWGTITSEPGSGGDVGRTRTVARPNGDGYLISGMKHFGSGSGMTSFMITTAVPDEDMAPDLFFLDMRDVPWDGSQGVELMFPWDGHGMTATQSHAMRFEDFPATRSAWPGSVVELAGIAGTMGSAVFSAVITGVVEIAYQTARERLEGRHDSLQAYEQVEWSRVEVEYWLAQQAYNGLITGIEQQGLKAARESLLAKTALAELSESILTRICKVMGGGTFSRHSPFGYWFEDVRALGFLRPPWVLAYNNIFAGSWQDT